MPRVYSSKDEAARCGSTDLLFYHSRPDEIRNDPRFHNDNSKPTPDIPGLPSGAQARRAGWHFTNIPFSMEGTPIRPPAEPNIVTVLRDMESFASRSDAEQVFLLPWLLHLVGDIHQPLHTMQRVQPQ